MSFFSQSRITNQIGKTTKGLLLSWNVIFVPSDAFPSNDDDGDRYCFEFHSLPCVLHMLSASAYTFMHKVETFLSFNFGVTATGVLIHALLDLIPNSVT